MPTNVRGNIELNPDDIFRPNLDALIDDTRTWVSPDGYRLSDRLWLAGERDRTQINKVLQDGLARGLHPNEVARNVEHLLNPQYQLRRDPETYRPLPLRKQPKGVATITPRQGPGKGTARPGNSGIGNYAARRLARTETTAAFGTATLRAALANPIVRRMRWRLSGHHDDSDECDQNAARSSKDQPRGVYFLDELPRYPNHPHEMCTISPYVTEADIDDAIPRLKRAAADGDFTREGLARPFGTTPVAVRPAFAQKIDGIRANYEGITGYGMRDEAERLVRQAGALLRKDALRNLTPEKRAAIQNVAKAQKETAAVKRELQSLWKQMQTADDAAYGELSARYYALRDGPANSGVLLRRATRDVQRTVTSEDYKEAFLTSLRKVRSVGHDAEHVFASNSDDVARAAFNGIRKELPTEWWQSSMDHPGGLRVIDQGPDARGVYMHNTLGPQEMAIAGQSSYHAELAHHEFMHRMEHIRRRITIAEDGFYARRTKGFDEEPLGGGYEKYETTIVDDFPERYMGKRYGNSAFEIATMGAQDLMRGGVTGVPRWLLEDDDLADFVAGIFAIG